MTRSELLLLLVGQARHSGFNFRRWFVENVAIPWSGSANAIEWLSKGQRAHMLIFSPEFAQCFWRRGERFKLIVPTATFTRVEKGRGTRTITRTAHVRRSSHQDTWRWHMREMAVAAEPLRYIRRYLITEESLQELSARPGEHPELRPALQSDFDAESASALGASITEDGAVDHDELHGALQASPGARPVRSVSLAEADEHANPDDENLVRAEDPAA